MAIWDDPNKVAGRWGADKTKLYSANSYKCPNCGSNLVYDVKQGGLVCGNCAGLFDPDTLETIGSFAIVNPERDYDGTIEISKEDEGRVEIVCNACGAEIVTDKNTSSTFCAFCGSPALVTRRLTREFKPDRIIPFKIDKEKAISLFEEHCSGISHLPKDFRSKKILSKMTGLYVPTWIISSEVEVKVVGSGRRGRTVDDAFLDDHGATSRDFQQTTYGKVNMRLKNVPFDGEIKIPNRLFAAAEPFDYSELVPFRSEYLQGFFAEKYDQQPLDMTDRIYNRLDGYALDVCKEVTFDYDAFVPNSDASHTRYYNQNIIYALLPCWFLRIEYDGIQYSYIVNGQTGKVSGTAPWNQKIFFAGIIGISAAICTGLAILRSTVIHDYIYSLNTWDLTYDYNLGSMSFDTKMRLLLTALFLLALPLSIHTFGKLRRLLGKRTRAGSAATHSFSRRRQGGVK